LVSSLVVQIILVLGDRMPSVDAVSYFETGRNFAHGNGYTRHGAAEMHFPPVAPIALGYLERLFGNEMYALRTWNLAWGVAIVVLLTTIAWFLSRDDDVVVATVWFATAVPGVVALGIRGGSGSELPTVTFILGAALTALVSLDPDRACTAKRRLGEVAGAGLLVGLAYLTRPESLLPGLTIGAISVLIVLATGSEPFRARIGHAALVGASFGITTLLLVAPYVIYQHHHSGAWSLTSKTKDASIDAWRAVAEDDRLERDQILYAIQPDGVSLGPRTRSLTAIAREYPRGWMTIGWINARTIFHHYLGTPWRWGPVWELIPLFLLVPAVATLWRTKRNRATLMFAAVGAWPLLTCFFFFALPRYLMLTTAVLIPFGVWGLVGWMRRLKRPGRTIGWWLIGALTLLSFVVASWTLLPGSNLPERTEQRAAGQWIAENTPTDARIMTRSFHVQGYSQREVVAFPYADYLATLDFARRMGVDYIVADESTIRRRRPELFGLLMVNDDPPEGLELVHELSQRGQTVKIFKLNPDPAPSPFPPLWLGYVSD